MANFMRLPQSMGGRNVVSKQGRIMDPPETRLTRSEVLHTEQLAWVRPDLLDGKARACRQVCKLLERIFVRALRPDALAQFEGNLTLPHANRLVFQTDQMPLDATLTRIIE